MSVHFETKLSLAATAEFEKQTKEVVCHPLGAEQISMLAYRKETDLLSNDFETFLICPEFKAPLECYRHVRRWQRSKEGSVLGAGEGRLCS